MSSAAMVSRRMRLSAKARSSAMVGVEVMAHHQHVEVLVDGVDGVGPRRVGGATAARSARPPPCRMSGAWPPPAPSVWKVWMRAALEGRDGVLDEAALVERVGVDGDLHVAFRRPRPGSSRSPPAWCPSLRAASGRWRRHRPARRSASGRLALPLPRKPRFIGKASAACSMRAMFQGPACRWWRRCRWPGPCRRRSWW